MKGREHCSRPFCIGVVNMKSFFQKCLSDNVAATAMEYAMIAALISVVAIGGISIISPKFLNNFTEIIDCLDDVTTC